MNRFMSTMTTTRTQTRTTLKDVARRVNLSPALVSGVLNNRENVWASSETRARVIEAARELDYHPSNAARALSQGRTTNVALVYRRLEGTTYRLAYSGLVDALSAEVQARDHDLTVANFATQEEVLDHLRRLANSRACDAVILWGREQDTAAQAELLAALHMPFLVKGRHEVEHPEWHQIDFDHEGMMAAAVERVVAAGHRRIAYLGFPHEDRFVRALRAGYVAAHTAALEDVPDPELFGEFDDLFAPNAERIGAWLARPEAERPTAFVIGSGNQAWRALETALAEVRRTLGPDRAKGQAAAAGVSSHDFTLLFGEAWTYEEIGVDALAREGAPTLLDALLSGREVDPIVRLRPELRPSPTLRLLEHGVALAGASSSSTDPIWI